MKSAWTPIRITLKSVALCLTALVVSCMCGCVSHKYFGVTINKERGNVAVYRPVASKYEQELDSFGKPCVQAFLAADAEKLLSMSTSELKKSIEPGVLHEMIMKIKKKYELNGKYEIQDLLGMPFWMDEWNFENQYDRYEFFVSRYLLYGMDNAYLVLFVSKKKDNEFRLWGFELHDNEKRTEIDFKSGKISEWYSPVFR